MEYRLDMTLMLAIHHQPASYVRHPATSRSR